MFKWSGKNKEADKIHNESDETERKKKLDEEIENLTGTKHETVFYNRFSPIADYMSSDELLKKPIVVDYDNKIIISYDEKKMRINADAIKKEITDHVNKELERFNKEINKNNADM